MAKQIIKLTENDLHTIIENTVSKILKEGTNSPALMDKWFEIQENMGAEAMNEAILKALDEHTIENLIKMFVQTYEM